MKALIALVALVLPIVALPTAAAGECLVDEQVNRSENVAGVYVSAGAGCFEQSYSYSNPPYSDQGKTAQTIAGAYVYGPAGPTGASVSVHDWDGLVVGPGFEWEIDIVDVQAWAVTPVASGRLFYLRSEHSTFESGGSTSESRTLALWAPAAFGTEGAQATFYDEDGAESCGVYAYAPNGTGAGQRLDATGACALL